MTPTAMLFSLSTVQGTRARQEQVFVVTVQRSRDAQANTVFLMQKRMGGGGRRMSRDCQTTKVFVFVQQGIIRLQLIFRETGCFQGVAAGTSSGSPAIKNQ